MILIKFLYIIKHKTTYVALTVVVLAIAHI
jgi:hypothetical protein